MNISISVNYYNVLKILCFIATLIIIYLYVRWHYNRNFQNNAQVKITYISCLVSGIFSILFITTLKFVETSNDTSISYIIPAIITLFDFSNYKTYSYISIISIIIFIIISIFAVKKNNIHLQFISIIIGIIGNICLYFNYSLLTSLSNIQIIISPLAIFSLIMAIISYILNIYFSHKIKNNKK